MNKEFWGKTLSDTQFAVRYSVEPTWKLEALLMWWPGFELELEDLPDLPRVTMPSVWIRS
jgi:hypothetical protein